MYILYVIFCYLKKLYIYFLSLHVAYPDAILRWYKKTSQGLTLINDDDKYDIQKLQSSTLALGETWYYLKVKNIQANDFGEYFCEGKNKEGTKAIRIILFGKLQYFNCGTSWCNGNSWRKWYWQVKIWDKVVCVSICTGVGDFALFILTCHKIGKDSFWKPWPRMGFFYF